MYRYITIASYLAIVIIYILDTKLKYSTIVYITGMVYYAIMQVAIGYHISYPYTDCKGR